MNSSGFQSKVVRNWPSILFVIVVVAASAALAIIKPPSSQIPDNRQILYWYAAQLRSGNGLVFNPGERVLLIASPAYMLLLAGFGSFLALPNVAQAAEWLFVVAAAVGALSLYRITRRAGLSLVVASFVALLYVFSWPLWLGVGTAIPVMTGVSLLALDLALESRWELAGLALAFAILCSPEAIFLALPLLFLAASRNALRRYALPLFIPLLLAVVALWLYYGQTLWDGLLILRPSQSTLASVVPWLLSIPVLGLAAYGWYRREPGGANGIDPTLSVAAAWAVLHLLVVGGLLRVQAGWQYAAIAGPALLLGVVGLQSLGLTLRRAAYSALAALVLLSSLLSLSREQGPPPPGLPGQPLSVGVMSTTQALRLRHYPEQVIVAFDGQLQPELKAMIERGDTQSMLIRYAPELLVVTDSGRIQPKALAEGPWSRLDYRPIDRSGTYLRYTSVGNFAERQTDVSYGLDIRLVGMAFDQESLRPGQLLRVRLDWDFARPASKPVTIDLRLESGEYVLAHAADEFAPSIFSEGRWSTYHTLTLATDAWPGPVTLTAGVIVNNGVISRAPLTILDVAR